MNDQDMVKVPRELLERWYEKLSGADSAGYGWEDLLSLAIQDILARPVADEQDAPLLAMNAAEIDGLIDQRDDAEDWADKLSEAIAAKLGVEIGEHSNANSPWEQALEAIDNVPIAQTEQKPVAFVNFHEMEACLHKPSSGEWIPVYTAPIAQAAPQGTNSDQYRAELYDEVWEKARSMGYGNVTDALVELERMKAAPQPEHSGLIGRLREQLDQKRIDVAEEAGKAIEEYRKNALLRAQVAELMGALDESQSLLVAMLHEQRPASEIESQVIANRAALSAQGGE